MFRAVAACAAVFSLLVAGTPASASPAGIDGTVTSARTGQPMKGIQVIAKTPDGGWVRDTTTDDAGRFDIPLTAGRQYRLFAHATEHHEQLSEPVTAPGSVSIALQPLTYGSVRGTYLRKPGQPIPDAGVELRDLNGNQRGWTGTDATGAFRFEHVLTGTYTLRYHFPRSSYHESERLTVSEDQETAVEQLARPMGAAEVTIRDSATGDPMANVAVEATLPVELGAGYTVRTDAQGKARFTDLLTGRWRFLISPPDGYLYNTIEDVEVAEDQTAHAEDALDREAVLDVTFVDAVTGAPVDGCVSLVAPDAHNAVDTSHSWCGTDGTGKLRLTEYWPGRQRLFAYPRTSTAHGSQWVGENGGTGDVEQAKWFDLVSGQTTAARVEFDGAGTIRGTVVDDETGAPVQEVCPSVTPSHTSPFQGRNVRCTWTEGTYEIGGLGPYEWKVQFPAPYGRYAWQWSGGAANRFDAAGVRVTAGGVATSDARLRKPGQITGKVVGATYPWQYTSIWAVDARTGDYVGDRAYLNDRYEYTMKGYGGQDVRVFFSASPDGVEEHPDTVHIGPGEVVAGIDLHVR
ncbi:carboxypeptidase regulatory-like domain-containing protein [Lentzea sp. CA-135723]|uniref:carboxypeptidase regulatory-like domain-containing protein n=1 Tax=Lentzea sp. CA-135723 TaxID=3239950 RepID=UPI003D8BC42F